MHKILIGLMFATWTSLAFAEETTVTISSADAPVVVLSLPAKVKVYSNPPKTTIVATNMFLSVWSVSTAKTAEEALPLVAETIKGDVLQFQATQTNVLTVAGAPAVHLIGNGVEADDGDPSTADVVVFAVGAQTFVACVHGEHNDASRERQPMLDALQTAKSP
jgi:hypothetical protein